MIIYEVKMLLNGVEYAYKFADLESALVWMQTQCHDETREFTLARSKQEVSA